MGRFPDLRELALELVPKTIQNPKFKISNSEGQVTAKNTSFMLLLALYIAHQALYIAHPDLV